MLFDATRFERLTATPWDADRVRAMIREIVADAEGTFDECELWPADEWDAWQTPTPLTTLYVGAAGVIWALEALRRREVAETSLDLARAVERAREAWLAEPSLMRGIELPEPARAGFLSGQTGILLVSHLVDPRAEIADELYERVRENTRNAHTGVMWGSPGTMLAARALHEWTDEARWETAWRESAAVVVDARDDDGFWEQRLYGDAFRGLGTLYGLVGNVLALLRGGEWLDDDTIVPRTAELLRETAVREDGLVNWPSSAGRSLRGAEGEIKLQWCCGAPGIVVSASSYLDEELVVDGAETVWLAGPHGEEKGSSICHGTAGNGYAMLAAFARTHDELWLDRARRFAVHALEQGAAARARRGRGRFSLWTGDAGVAIFAADCLLAQTAYPVLGTWA